MASVWPPSRSTSARRGLLLPESGRPVLTVMIERAHAQHDSTSNGRRAELTAIAHQITSTEAAITRYHATFEKGTMDDATAGPRIR